MLSPMSWPITTILFVSFLNTFVFLSRLLTRLPLGSYDYFCFFDSITNSQTRSDDFAFFVFFTFKSMCLYALTRLTYSIIATQSRLEASLTG